MTEADLQQWLNYELKKIGVVHVATAGVARRLFELVSDIREQSYEQGYQTAMECFDDR